MTQTFFQTNRDLTASHLGLLLDKPAIGCAKTLLVGRHGPLTLGQLVTYSRVRMTVLTAVRSRLC